MLQKLVQVEAGLCVQCRGVHLRLLNAAVGVPSALQVRNEGDDSSETRSYQGYYNSPEEL